MKYILNGNKKIRDLLWFAVALSTPLFSVSFLRIDVDLFHLNFHFAVSVIIMFIIFFTGMLSLGFKKGAWAKIALHKRYGDLLVLTLTFFLWHVLSISRSYDVTLAVKNTIRLLAGMIVFWCVLIFFPRDSRFLRKFFNILSLSLSFMLLYLLYVYAFVLKAPFLSSDLDQEARWGKNQLSYFIARVLPFAFFRFYFSRDKFVYFFPVLILAISMVYAASRGGWGSLFFGFVFILGFILYKERAAGLKSMLKIVVSLFLIFGASILILSRIVSMDEILNRFNSIYNPNSTAALYYSWKPVLPENNVVPSVKVEVPSPVIPANLPPPPSALLEKKVAPSVKAEVPLPVIPANLPPPPSALPEKKVAPSVKAEVPLPVIPANLPPPPSALPEKNAAPSLEKKLSSYEVRGRRVEQALHGFMTSPIIGVGLANANSYADGLIHNDYAAILLEMGSVGGILFLGILWAVTRRLFAGKLLRNRGISWVYLGAIGSWAALLVVSMVFDSYVAAYYWMFLALFVVIAETEEQLMGTKGE